MSVFLALLLAPQWAPGPVLEDPSGVPFDLLGGALDRSGDLLAAGVPRADSAAGADTGKVLVFARDPATGSWSLDQEVHSWAAVLPGERFGEDVALDGGRLLAGAPLSGPLATGAALFYTWDDALQTWRPERRVIPSELTGGETFGAAVALDGDFAAVGAPETPFFGASQAGAVWTYRWDASLGWVEEQKLQSALPIRDERFGVALDLEGDRLAVGAHGDDQRGAVHIFERDPASGQWLETAVLEAPLGDAQAGDLFGTAVDLRGDELAVGCFQDDEAALDAGALYRFVRDPGSGVWILAEKIVPPDLQAGDKLGTAVALDAGRIAAGAPFADTLQPDSGAVFVWRFDGNFGEWRREEVLPPASPAPGDRFGQSLILGDGELLAGAPGGDGTAGTDSGLLEVRNLVRLEASPDPVWTAGGSASLTARGFRPDESAWLAYSLAGLGGQFVPPLGITIALGEPAVQVGPGVPTDAQGEVTWNLAIPAGAAGRLVWFQAAQAGQASEVRPVQVQ